MDLQHLRNRVYTELSGGEKQRTQLARVIAQIWRKEDASKRLLILDEPTNALDLGHQQQLLQFLKNLAKDGVCIILVVHDLNIAAKIADKILLMCCGESMAFGAPEAVFKEEVLELVFGAKIRVTRAPDSNELLVLS
jgi:iron complex transport system ATP-binding protein